MAADSAYHALSNRAATLVHQGVSTLQLEEAVREKYGHQAIHAAYKYLHELIVEVENAADWKSLNRIAAPLLGPASFSAGLAFGLAESLVHDVVGLLKLGKMIILAGVYQRLKHPILMVVPDPISLALVIAARNLPAFAAQVKAADDELQQLLSEIGEIARHPVVFIETVGKNVWKGAEADWKQLKQYSTDKTISNDFKAGRITGHALYQVLTAILLVLSAAGAVTKLVAEVPALIEFAQALRRGATLEELQALPRTGGMFGGAGKGASDALTGDVPVDRPPPPPPKPPPPPPPAEPPPPSRAQTSSKPEWLRKLDEGNKFDDEQSINYPNNEVYIDRPDGNGYYRLDSYNPENGEIVSRKFTQLSDVQESTAQGYVNELATKYPPGARIADVPSSGTLAGEELQGQPILEVPVQNQPVPQSVIDTANRQNVIIRDVNGNVYN